MRRALLAIVLALAACGGSNAPPEECQKPPTFTNDIFPLIVQPKCLPCHSEERIGNARRGAPAGLDFNRLDLVLAQKEIFADAITSGREPPNDATDILPVTREERDSAVLWRHCDYPP